MRAGTTSLLPCCACVMICWGVAARLACNDVAADSSTARFEALRRAAIGAALIVAAELGGILPRLARGHPDSALAQTTGL